MSLIRNKGKIKKISNSNFKTNLTWKQGGGEKKETKTDPSCQIHCIASFWILVKFSSYKSVADIHYQDFSQWQLRQTTRIKLNNWTNLPFQTRPRCPPAPTLSGHRFSPGDNSDGWIQSLSAFIQPRIMSDTHFCSGVGFSFPRLPRHLSSCS